MGRRELMLGIAEKLPKSTRKPPKAVAEKAVAEKAIPAKAIGGKATPAKALPKAATPPAIRRRIVALEARSLRKRH